MTMKCCNCGRPIGAASIISHGHPEHVLCEQCGQYLYRCETCAHESCGVNAALHGAECPFPPVVQVTTQEGFMVTTQPRINPRLVDVYCEDCMCREDRRCVRWNDYTCDKYELGVKYNE